VDWKVVIDGIRQYGIRNAAQTTIAPTGTIATVAGCEGYGCEPVFALAYIRHVNDNGKDLQLTYTSPLFEKALLAAGLDEESQQMIINHIMETGTCQDLPGRILVGWGCRITFERHLLFLRTLAPRNTYACRPPCRPSSIIVFQKQ